MGAVTRPDTSRPLRYSSRAGMALQHHECENEAVLQVRRCRVSCFHWSEAFRNTAHRCPLARHRLAQGYGDASRCLIISLSTTPSWAIPWTALSGRQPITTKAAPRLRRCPSPAATRNLLEHDIFKAILLLESKMHLLRLLQEIRHCEAEQTAIEDGVADYENLLSKLADMPTPAGPTQRQIGAELMQITTVRSALQASWIPVSTGEVGPCDTEPCAGRLTGHTGHFSHLVRI